MDALKDYGFDPEILKKSLKIMEVQDILLYSDNYNYETNSLTLSEKLNDKEITPLDYSYCVYTIERYDSIRAKHYAQITSEIGRQLLSKYHNFPVLHELKREILERIFFPLNYSSTPHILLYFLEKTGFYEGKDFLDRIIQLKRKTPNKIKFTVPFLVWFLPQFENYDPEFYIETLNQFQNYEKSDEFEENDEFFTFYVNYGRKQPYFKENHNFRRTVTNNIEFNDINFTYEDILNQEFFDPISYSLVDKYDTWFFRPKILSKFKKNDWELHSFLCEHGYFPGSIEEAIATDNLEKFLEFYQKSTISYDTQINYNIFCHSHVIRNNSNLIEFSSIYCSVNIFKYLINSIENNRLFELTNHPLNVCFLATYGGCSEIIKICDSFGVDIKVSFHCSACFYRHEILSWLIEYKNFDVNSYLNNYLYPIHQCASSNNLRGFFYLLLKGADMNKTVDDDGNPTISPFTFGVEFSCYHTTSLILSSEKLAYEGSSNDMIKAASKYSDVNIFLNVFNFLKKNQNETNLINSIRYIYTPCDINTSEFIYEYKKNHDVSALDPSHDFEYGISQKNFLLASLIFNKFYNLFNNAIDHEINVVLMTENTEAVKILINSDQFMKEKLNFYGLLLQAISFKRLDVVKIILSKLKVNELKLSDLLDVFEISRIDSIINNSATLFYKVFKFEEKEFFLFFILILQFLIYFFFYTNH